MSWTLVTGAAVRLGAAISLELAKAGRDLVIHYHTRGEEAEKMAIECRSFGVRAETIAGDFSEPGKVADFLKRYQERFASTSALVNNVGNYFILSALKTPLEIWQELFQLNLFAPVQIIQALSESLIQQEGRIVNLGVAGLQSEKGDVYSSAYSACKSALLSLTRSLAKELAQDKVTVNMVSPGIVDITVDPPQDPTKLPMGRMASTAEVARVVLFLLDPKSAYLTGQNIEVSGGVRL